jgi:hypothetical protein
MFTPNLLRHVGATQAELQSVTKFIATTAMTYVTLKVAAKLELLFNKRVPNHSTQNSKCSTDSAIAACQYNILDVSGHTSG